MPSKRLTVEEIIKQDIKKNNNDITFEEGMSIFNKYIKKGLQVFRVNNTLFLIEKDAGNTIYYHTINADDIKGLLKNSLRFFSFMANAGKDVAITYFDSDRLLKILEKYKLPGEVIQVSDNQKKGVYMLTTDLNMRSK